MPNVTRTWTFAVSVEGWTGGFTWNGTGLEASGSIHPPTGEDITADYLQRSPAGTTWRDLGVPDIALAVTNVQITGGSHKRIAESGVQAWAADLFMVNAANTVIIDSINPLGYIDLPIGTDSTYISAYGGGSQAILAPYQSPTTVVSLVFGFSVTSPVGPSSCTYDCAFNNFQLTMTYTVPYTANFPALTLAP